MIAAAIDVSLAIMPEGFRSSKHRTFAAAFVAVALAAASPASADCAPEPQGEGRVEAAIDARTLRLMDGRTVRLSGLAPLRGEAARHAEAHLARVAAGRTVSIHSDDSKPDRHGQQRGWLFADDAEVPLQETMIAAGHGLRDISIADADCRGALESAEIKARRARIGLWQSLEAIKNAETPDDISREIGHFTLVGGQVRSVRESGGWTYLNFGRRWSEGFAAMVPKGTVAAFDKAGQPLKGFEGQRVLIRGYVAQRRGPRLEIASPQQIELADGKAVATAGTRD